MLRARPILVLLALLLAGASFLAAQSFTAAMRGVVTDPTGAVVAGAKITVTEADRNVSRTVFTDEAGRYVAPNLNPGFYTLTVEASGFKRHVQSRFELVVQ